MVAKHARKAQIRERMAATGETYTEAAAVIDDPGARIICHTCGWTAAMTCPECAGCGCDRMCNGWRHEEFSEPEDWWEAESCPECGGHYLYGCVCP